MRQLKYGNRKTTVNGITFDSKKEANRYQELLLMQRAGIITDLQRQVRYVLIPTQREKCFERDRKGNYKQGRVIEKECVYVADFVYTTADGLKVVEDAKGVRTPLYVLKRKLMLFIHGIKIHEV